MALCLTCGHCWASAFILLASITDAQHDTCTTSADTPQSRNLLQLSASSHAVSASEGFIFQAVTFGKGEREVQQLDNSRIGDHSVASGGTVSSPRSIARPAWVKKNFCKSDDLCYDCSKGTGCWMPQADTTQEVAVDQDNPYAVFEVHLARGLRKVVNADWKVNVKGGTLHMFWDGYELNATDDYEIKYLTGKSPVKYSDKKEKFDSNGFEEGWTRISPYHSGGHQFEFIFALDAGQTQASATVELVLWEEPAAIQRADKQGCMVEFNATDMKSMSLREENAMQMSCFQGSIAPEYKDYCTKLLECLDKSPDVSAGAMTEMLVAAGIGDKELESLQLESTDTFCLDPRFEDPEAWCMDCYATMKKQCEVVATSQAAVYSDGNCFRAQYCNHESVCGSWKKKACISSEVVTLMAALKSLADSTKAASTQTAALEMQATKDTSRYLLARRGSQNSRRLEDASLLASLDGSVTGKHCV